MTKIQQGFNAFMLMATMLIISPVIIAVYAVMMTVTRIKDRVSFKQQLRDYLSDVQRDDINYQVASRHLF